MLLDAKEKAVMLWLCALLFVGLQSISKDGHEPCLLLLKKQDTAGCIPALTIDEMEALFL